MTNTQALEARPTANVGLAKPMPRASLSDRMQEADAIARAIPNLQPGHILLSMHWSERHGLDLMTAVQNVAWINGKPNYSAELWEHFAGLGGWQVYIAEIDEQHCKAELYRLDEDPRSAQTTPTASWTSTLKDRNVKNKIWDTHPRQMLRGNAIRNLVKFHANTGVAGMADSSVEFAPIDVVEVLAAATVAHGEDAVVVEEAPAEKEPAPAAPVAQEFDVDDVDEVKAMLKGSGISQVEALRAAQAINTEITSIKALAVHPEVLKQVLAGAA